jgi:serine/threonine protein kinase
MEKCECSVMSRLIDMPNTAESDLASVFSNMLAALAHLHSQRIVHRDIKPDNYLYGGSTTDTIKLCDFGMARILPKSGKLYGKCGTAPYMSPEMVGDRGYNTLTDVWSLGTTCYLMLYGKFPYEARDPEGMLNAIARGVPAPDYESSPQPTGAARTFVSGLLNRESGARPAAEKALRFPYLCLRRHQHSSDNLQSVLHSGEELRKEFMIRADPTEQRTLDELLERLQVKQMNYFSEEVKQTCYLSENSKREDQEVKERSCVRRPTRASTYSGEDNSRHSKLLTSLSLLSVISESTHEGKSECDQCSDSTKSFHDISLSVDCGLDEDYGHDF